MTGTSRRRLLAATAAGLGALAGCGYRPGAGDVRWSKDFNSNVLGSSIVVRDDRTLYDVVRSSRGFDFEQDQWVETGRVATFVMRAGDRGGHHTYGPLGRPAVHDGVLYVGTEERELLAIDRDGTERWRTDVRDFPRWVAAGGDRVYGLSPEGPMTAYDRSGGEMRWERDVAAWSDARCVATDDGVVVVGLTPSGEATITCFERGGARRWTDEDPNGISGSVAVVTSGDRLYLTLDERLSVRSLANGEEAWSQYVDRPTGPPVPTRDAVFQSGRGTLFAFDAATGDELWTYDPPSLRSRVSPPGADDTAVFVGSDDTFTALSAEDGSVRWQVASERVVDAYAFDRTAVAVVEGTIRGHWRER